MSNIAIFLNRQVFSGIFMEINNFLLKIIDTHFFLLYIEKVVKNTSRGVAQFGSASALGAEGRMFESCHPDQIAKKTTDK